MFNPTFSETAELVILKAKSLVNTSGIKAPPVNPRLLAQIHGIQRVITSTTLECSGQLVQEGNKLVIKLDSKEPTQRQNFTCCHEIAHTFFLHGALAKNRNAARVLACSRFSPEEQLCDLAAAEMLMPEKFFKPAAAELEPSIQSVVNLASRFMASISSTSVRIGQLKAWPVVFLVWKFTKRDGSVPKLRAFWSVRPAGHRCYIPRHAPADPHSGMYATFLTGHPTCEQENLDLGSLRGKYLVENGKFSDYVLSIVHAPKF